MWISLLNESPLFCTQNKSQIIIINIIIIIVTNIIINTSLIKQEQPLTAQVEITPTESPSEYYNAHC